VSGFLSWLRSADNWQGLHWEVENQQFEDQLKQAVRRPMPADMRQCGIFHCDDLTGAWGQPADTHLFLADLYNPEEWIYTAPPMDMDVMYLHKIPHRWCDFPFVLYAAVRAGFVFQLTVNNGRNGTLKEWGGMARLHGYPLICTLPQAVEALGEPQKAIYADQLTSRYWMHLYEIGDWAYYVNIIQVYSPESEFVHWHTIYAYRRMLGRGRA
jgi:hypothetical protein